jgi:hypothetical protein
MYVQTTTNIFKRRVHIVNVLAITDAVSGFGSNDELIPKNNTRVVYCWYVSFSRSAINNESVTKKKINTGSPLPYMKI